MLRTHLWGQSASRIEIDRRSREARLRFEQTDRLFLVRSDRRGGGPSPLRNRWFVDSPLERDGFEISVPR